MAARLLARAPRTEAELEARLLQLGYRPATAAATVARCRELGYVDDGALAHDRARVLRSRGHGSLHVEADLAARGVADALVAAAVAESRDGEPEIAWARRALRGERDRARAWRFLLGRGFPETVVADLLGD